MAERQRHGFDFEQKVLEENSISKTENYTDKWDSFEQHNGINYPVSMKTAINGIDCGDVRRQSSIDQDFIFYVGFWKWKNKERIFIEEYKLLIKNENWKKYFGNIDIFPNLYEEMKNISNDYSDDVKWFTFRKKYTNLYGDAIITLRFKRDHKNQKRMQCGISKNKFFNVVLKENEVLSHKVF